GGTAVSGAAAGGVDLDLEGGQDRIDFDVMGEPIPAHDEQGLDLDIGTAIGERDPAAEAAALRATDRNIALDDRLALPEDSTVEHEVTAATATRQMLSADSATGSTQEMTARTRELASPTREMTATLEQGATLEHEATWDSDEASREAPTVEQPMLASDNPTIRQKVEMALRAGAGEHTTELALDDLGLDLTALAPTPDVADGGRDTLDQPALAGAHDAPTMVAGLDEHSRQLMESAERRSVGADGELKVSETGTWHFDADPFAGGGAGDARAADLSATSRLGTLKAGTLDFELGESQSVARLNGGGVDLDVGTATVPDTAFTATQRLGADDLALPDLDPVTMSEVGTKLDLARAYMDMGDPEGARNILDEVLNEGSAAQKQEAERLIASLPG
ncbi:MAG: FimV/HubP family polar landmark protein, partial [Steroidobacteraceae bacterium]